MATRKERALLLAACFLALASVARAADSKSFLSPKELVELGEKSEVSYATRIVDSPDQLPVVLPPGKTTSEPHPPLPFPWVESSADGLHRSLTTYTLSSVALSALEEAEPLFREKKYEEARKVYSEAARVDPDCYVLHSHIGDCYFMTGRARKALKEYKRALALNPNDFHGYWYRASALHALGRFEAARRSYARALALSPKNESILSAVRSRAKDLGVTLYDQPFHPLATARQEDEAITVYAVEGTHWWGYGLCRAIWIGEPTHRQAMTGSTDHKWTTTEELECLLILLQMYRGERNAGEVDEEPELERLWKILEGRSLNQFILYELGSVFGSEFAILLDQKTQEDVAEYVSRYVLATEE